MHELPKLTYAFDALEPHIDARTMEIHHDKHHAAYVANLNKALEAHSNLQGKGVGRSGAGSRRPAGGDPHRGAQQRRRSSQPQPILGDHGARRRRLAQR